MIDGAGSRGARPFLFIPSTGRRSQGAGTAIPGAMGIGTSAVPKENRTPTLMEVGIDYKLSSRAQKESIGLNRGTAGTLRGPIPMSGTNSEPLIDTRPTLAEGRNRDS